MLSISKEVCYKLIDEEASDEFPALLMRGIPSLPIGQVLGRTHISITALRPVISQMVR